MNPSDHVHHKSDMYVLQVTTRLDDMDVQSISGIPEAESFGRNRKFSAFGFRFRLPKLKAEYGRNSRKALDGFFSSVFQDENIMAWFS